MTFFFLSFIERHAHSTQPPLFPFLNFKTRPYSHIKRQWHIALYKQRHTHFAIYKAIHTPIVIYKHRHASQCGKAAAQALTGRPFSRC